MCDRSKKKTKQKKTWKFVLFYLGENVDKMDSTAHKKKKKEEKKAYTIHYRFSRLPYLP